MRTSLFASLLLLMLLFVVDAKDEQWKTTREEILAGRKRRSAQLESLLIDAKQRLDDHVSGRKLLTDADKISLEKKIDIFQRKLETMTGEIDEREVERILLREEILAERQMEREEKRRRREEL